MSVTILGGGAVGLFLSSLLSQSDNTILITRTVSQAKIINNNGIFVSGLTNFCTKKVLAVPFNSSKLKPVLSHTKILFLCLKSYDTKNVLSKLKNFVLQNTIIVTVQNGLGNKEIITQIFPQNRVLESVITFGVTKVLDNKIIFCGSGEIITSPLIKKYLNLRHNFLKNLVKLKYVRNTTFFVWQKFIINCAINPVGTILNLKNGELIGKNYTKNLMKQIFEEAFLVAKSYNIKIPKNIFKKIVEVCLRTKENFNSMLQDVLKHKNVTEIEFLNGKLLNLAKQKGLYLPANETVYELIKTIEQTY
jgi:2-dehydropantoate 2-reductase